MSESKQSRSTGLPMFLAILAVLAIIDALVLTSTHAKLLSQPDFESFCNISAEVSCDSALASGYSKLLGVPVSLFALVAYALMLGLAVIDLKARQSGDEKAVGAGNRLFALAGFNLAFSLYMAGASAFDLRVLCILCAGLYLIALAAIVVSFLNLPDGIGGFAQGLQTEIKDSLGSFGGSFMVQAGAVIGAAALVIVFNTGNPMGPPEGKEPHPAKAVTAAGESPAANDDEAKHALQLENLKKWISTLPEVTVGSAYHTPKGTVGAPIRIEEFADFQCPACGRAWELLSPIMKKHADKIEVYFHHFPLSSDCNPGMQSKLHEHACGAARAAVCAEQQGKFWEYANQLFTQQRNLSNEKYLEWAEQLGLDRAKFETCWKDPASLEPVSADIKEGVRIQVNSTPTLVINGRKFRGFDILRPELFELMLELEGLN